MPAVVRLARPEEFGLLEALENSADELLIERFRPSKWPTAPNSSARAEMAGFIYVVEESAGGGIVGFAQVLEIDGQAHLEQLSVIPSHGRRGYGRALVSAVGAEAKRRGYGSVTLRTYADVPWNAPFYADCGFVESRPDTAFLRALVRTEARLGLDDHGRRLQMTADASVLAGATRRRGDQGWVAGMPPPIDPVFE